ncbi:2Fe-2S iron-sulfur cluster-binding protein [Variovorax paradoxus]|uniref:2Fe-2S iron-sulfur cluster-binding protein n=1 Tax=Variovorax paradoxus TaxID=34073 RepID=UPI003521EC3F
MLAAVAHQPQLGDRKGFPIADISVSCAGGICGACRTRWIEGPPIHRDRALSPQERAHEGIVCVAECAGSRLVLDL